MNHEVLKNVIFDQHDVIKNAEIVDRRYTFEKEANYVLTGLRRAGKSTIMHKAARNLVEAGVSWDQIISINFEDERLAEFTTADFNDIVMLASEMSSAKPYFFFDEIHNILGWEKFARRLVDGGDRVWITGSNAHMLSSQIATTLGGRYFIKHITPYRYDEFLLAKQIKFDKNSRSSTKGKAALSAAFDNFYKNGGFPESLRYSNVRDYIESIYQKVLLGDVVARSKIRNPDALRLLVKKIAESVCNEISVSSLHGCLKALGYNVGKATLIEYIEKVQEAYLLFDVKNAVAKFVEREGNPKRYFSDNGLLNLFLVNKQTALLENEIAVAMKDAYGESLHYLKSNTHGIDIDFYVAEENLAVQVAYALTDTSTPREISNLVKLAKVDSSVERFLIITKEDEREIIEDGIKIEILPAWKYLLELAI